MEDGVLCSAVQEALLALIIHEEARGVGERRGKTGLGYFFRFLCSLHACCREPPSIISLGYLFGMRSEKTGLEKLTHSSRESVLQSKALRKEQ